MISEFIVEWGEKGFTNSDEIVKTIRKPCFYKQLTTFFVFCLHEDLFWYFFTPQVQTVKQGDGVSTGVGQEKKGGRPKNIRQPLKKPYCSDIDLSNFKRGESYGVVTLKE